MFCPNCGANIADDSKFCGVCGTNISEVTSETVSKEAAGDNTSNVVKSDSVVEQPEYVLPKNKKNMKKS